MGSPEGAGSPERVGSPKGAGSPERVGSPGLGGSWTFSALQVLQWDPEVESI